MVGAWQTWTDEWVTVCESGEGTCWILGIKQLLRAADGRLCGPVCITGMFLILNDERYRKGWFFPSLEPRSQGESHPLGLGGHLVGRRR